MLNKTYQKPKFREGQVVCLTNEDDAVRMVVEEIKLEEIGSGKVNSYVCVWFDRDRRLRREVLLESALVLYTEEAR